MREKVPVLVDRAALDRHAIPHGGDRLVEPRRAIDDEKLGPAQAALDEIVEDGTPGRVLAAHVLSRHHLLAVSRTPMTTRSEMEVALRSSRTRTTVPSRMSRTIGSSASERAFHASQSPFTLRQVRHRVLVRHRQNRAPSARRTRCVSVPATEVLAISASPASVRR